MALDRDKPQLEEGRAINTAPADSAARARRITRTSFIGVAANILLASFKAAVGLLANSVSIVLDAVNNLTDALSSILTIVGVKLAHRPPDEKHPFGHGRIEYFSAISIAGLIVAAGAGSFLESVKKIIHPVAPEYGMASIIVVAVAIAVKILLGRYVSSEGRACNSDALVASGADAGFDAILSAATLAGALVMLATGINLDGWIGAVISVFILKAGGEMLLDSVGNILGIRPDSEITKRIRKTVEATPGVLGAYDLVLHNYGPDTAIGSIHVEIDAALDARAIHRLTRRIQTEIFAKFRVFITVGVYAVDPEHAADRDEISATALRHPGVKAIHGVFFDDERNSLSFDALLDFTVRDREALRSSLVSELSPKFPGREISIAFDTDYAD